MLFSCQAFAPLDLYERNFLIILLLAEGCNAMSTFDIVLALSVVGGTAYQWQAAKLPAFLIENKEK